MATLVALLLSVLPGCGLFMFEYGPRSGPEDADAAGDQLAADETGFDAGAEEDGGGQEDAAPDVAQEEVEPGCGNGRVDDGEECDDGKNGDPDDGCRDDCRFSCHDGGECDDGHVCTEDQCGISSHRCSHAPSSSGTVCRASAGVCDVPESCGGSGGDCPADSFMGSGLACRFAAGVCDTSETCTGTSATCPADAFRGSGAVCRSHAGICDVAETCTGSSAGCPSDAFAGSGVVCRAKSGYCDAQETCAGTAAACPENGSMSCGTGKHCDRDFCIHDGFVLIPAGSFTMGSPPDELGRGADETQHSVTLTIPFEMMAHEVTQGEFYGLMGVNPSRFPSCGMNCPVEQVNWHDALDYANRLSSDRGLAQCFECTDSGLTTVTCALKSEYARPQDCPGFRLPTEAEWEYAARAGTTSAYYSGGIAYTDCTPLDTNLDAIGWYCGNSAVIYSGCADISGSGGPSCAGTHSVGEKQANAWGLFDMSGNVFEWIWDWFGTYPGTVSDYHGPATGSLRVFRGSSWNYYAYACRSAERHYSPPGDRYISFGFRLVRSLP